MHKFQKAYYEIKARQRTLFLEAIKRRIHERNYGDKIYILRHLLMKQNVQGNLGETI
jgi:hypothetical protein